MRITVFSSKAYDQLFLDAANADQSHEIFYQEPHLNSSTASLAKGAEIVCVFVNDIIDRDTLKILKKQGVKLIAMRCAGFNNVDLKAADEFNIKVCRVPAYSPYSVAEHTLALVLGLNRHLHRAYNRVRDGNFSLNGFIGFDLHGKTVGIVGTGKIGTVTMGLFKGFGCKLLAYDVAKNTDCLNMGANYVDLDTMFKQSDIVSLHCPLNPATHNMVDANLLSKAKQGLMLINTGRGALINTQDVIEALKAGRLGSLGLDVYEEEADLFFEDLSTHVIRDDQFARLMTFPNVLVTGHQAFFTQEALSAIAETTIENINAFSKSGSAIHEVSIDRLA
ncbi:2-hydroxyacid dehydrogenase [Hirschia maritima]|uniref:2-hydroxyacid dehydrogenase n=1 Tax=Hirschia maritima TaxID=1121961 RepID=UPI0003652AB2|nr:2-hydroxyacid dehydrogenase [Hirschia maritima]